MKRYWGLNLVVLASLALAQPTSQGRYWQIIANPSQAEILQNLAGRSSAVWQTSSSSLTFAYAGEAKGNISLCCGVFAAMPQVSNNLFAISIRFEALEMAVLTWSFFDQDKTLTPTQVWRGSQAPLPPPSVDKQRGKVITQNLKTAAFQQARAVSIYFPPNFDPTREHHLLYMADGQALESYAQVLEPMNLPVVLIGFHSGENRYNEYVQTSSALFLAHERFVKEAVQQLDQRYKLKPLSRWLFGFSNGADWVLRMLARQPKNWAGGMAFSPFNTTNFDAKAAKPPALYLEAGLYEPAFEVARAVKKAAEGAKMRVLYNERAAGHDGTVWREEFPTALRWLLK